MSKIDRNSVLDAEQFLNNFLPNEKIKTIILSFLSEAILYANQLKRDNWNLNLDTEGKFIKFNVGQVYCITLFKDKILVICLKNLLEKIEELDQFDIKFEGYIKKKSIVRDRLEDTPDCLAKVPNSVGCIIKYSDTPKILAKIKEANFSFIKEGIERTTILLNSKRAHSEGAISALSRIVNKKIPNPEYEVSENEYYKQIIEEEREAKKISDEDLEERINRIPKERNKIKITTTKYIRNPYISEFVRRKANGICQECKKPAPFINKHSGEPYLEIHHKKALSKGGYDSIDNTIALCPNCHRKMHFGNI